MKGYSEQGGARINYKVRREGEDCKSYSRGKEDTKRLIVHGRWNRDTMTHEKSLKGQGSRPPLLLELFLAV